LAAADITVGSIVMPISSVYAITGKKRNKCIFQTSDIQICYASHRDGTVHHFNAREALRLIFSGITVNLSYIIAHFNFSVSLIGCSFSYLNLI
jgi:hypothetical protein